MGELLLRTGNWGNAILSPQRTLPAPCSCPTLIMILTLLSPAQLCQFYSFFTWTVERHKWGENETWDRAQIVKCQIKLKLNLKPKQRPTPHFLNPHMWRKFGEKVILILVFIGKCNIELFVQFSHFSLLYSCLKKLLLENEMNWMVECKGCRLFVLHIREKCDPDDFPHSLNPPYNSDSVLQPQLQIVVCSCLAAGEILSGPNEKRGPNGSESLTDQSLSETSLLFATWGVSIPFHNHHPKSGHMSFFPRRECRQPHQPKLSKQREKRKLVKAWRDLNSHLSSPNSLKLRLVGLVLVSLCSMLCRYFPSCQTRRRRMVCSFV